MKKIYTLLFIFLVLNSSACSSNSIKGRSVGINMSIISKNDNQFDNKDNDKTDNTNKSSIKEYEYYFYLDSHSSDEVIHVEYENLLIYQDLSGCLSMYDGKDISKLIDEKIAAVSLVNDYLYVAMENGNEMNVIDFNSFDIEKVDFHLPGTKPHECANCLYEITKDMSIVRNYIDHDNNTLFTVEDGITINQENDMIKYYCNVDNNIIRLIGTMWSGSIDNLYINDILIDSDVFDVRYHNGKIYYMKNTFAGEGLYKQYSLSEYDIEENTIRNVCAGPLLSYYPYDDGVFYMHDIYIYNGIELEINDSKGLYFIIENIERLVSEDILSGLSMTQYGLLAIKSNEKDTRLVLMNTESEFIELDRKEEYYDRFSFQRNLN